MPDNSGAPPTIGSSSSKIQTQRGGRGRFNPAGRGGGGGGGRGGGHGRGHANSNNNPQHPGHIPGSLSSRPLNGIFAIDKPSGRTSMSLLEDLKMLLAFSPLFRNPDGSIPEGYGGKAWQPREPWCKKYKKSTGPPKVGQGGTLDPLASGVLVVGIGNGTKALQEYLDCAKTYTSVGLLGASTTSYDVMDPIMHRVKHTHVTPELITSLLPYFTGPLLQYPPLYSAVKIDGKRLFDYARTNTPLPRPIEAREVEITELALVDWFDAGEHTWAAPDRELPEEEKALVGRVKELVGQSERDGDTVVQRGELERVREEQMRDGEGGAATIVDEGAVTTVDEGAADDAQAAVKDGATESEIKAEHADVAQPETIADTNAVANSEPAPSDSSSTSNESHLPPAAFRLRMTVSSGTYVRSIIHDVGLACESASHVVELRRTKQGEWFTQDHHHSSEEDEQTSNVLPWKIFDDALKQLRIDQNPNNIKVDGAERELKAWERALLERIKPL